MALLDVTEVLFDPILCDDFAVVRSTRSVSQAGLTVDTPGYYTAYGSVQPSSGADLNILPEMERIGAHITVTTTFRLVALTDSTAADQVVWNGKLYRVMHVNDWSAYGQGFVEAICQLTGMTPDQSPTSNTSGIDP